MTPAFVLAHTIPAALSLLPKTMDTPAARAMLLAIGLQESLFEHRVQFGGPARGYWQFEEHGGVAGVLTHHDSRVAVRRVCDALGYKTYDHSRVYQAIADNDILACAFARLLLWTLPDPLPARSETSQAWHQYLGAWRPGKPHPEAWAENWNLAWKTIEDQL